MTRSWWQPQSEGAQDVDPNQGDRGTVIDPAAKVSPVSKPPDEPAQPANPADTGE